MNRAKRTLAAWFAEGMLLCLIWLGACCLTGGAQEPDDIPAEPPVRWWKGNLHTHSFWSDGNDFPEMIAEWYRTRGYNFLALSDHNVLSEGRRWIALSEVEKRGGADVLHKYQSRFGGDWVELRQSEGPESAAVRLKPLNEFRSLVEHRGRFIMMASEEISDQAEGKPVHLNAANLKELVRPVGGSTVREAIANNLRAVEEQATKLQREILLHLNHPNFGYAVTAEDLAAVAAERFFEIYNGHPAVGHLGDKVHPGLEQLWDIANTLRIAKFNAPPLYGLGVDDSHEYHGRRGSRPGRGWVMVQSRYLTAEHVLKAMKAGRFYASSGVVLEDVSFDAADRKLKIRIRPQEGVEFTTRFVGTLSNYDDASEPRVNDQGQPLPVTRRYSSDVGRVLATQKGLEVEYAMSGDELYVRAIVTSTTAHPDPSFEGQREQAWTQPVGWEQRVTRTQSPATE